jgi:hypothetical protein
MSEPEQVVALTTETDGQPQVAAPPADVPAEPANAETKAETTTDAAVPASSNTLTPADASASIAEAKPVSIALTSKPTPAASSGAPASSTFDMASAKFAALNDPATTAWKDPPAKAKADSKADSGSPESKATKPRAHRVKKRRRIVRRPPPPVQQLDPFGQPQPTLAATTMTAQTSTPALPADALVRVSGEVRQGGSGVPLPSKEGYFHWDLDYAQSGASFAGIAQSYVFTVAGSHEGSEGRFSIGVPAVQTGSAIQTPPPPTPSLVTATQEKR